MFTGLSGKAWETPKIAHESHNDVRRMRGHAGATFVLLAELGLRKPPSGNPEGLAWQGRRLHLPASAVVKQSQWIGGKRDIHGSRDIHGLQLVSSDLGSIINRSGGVYPSYLVIHIQAASRNVGP